MTTYLTPSTVLFLTIQLISRGTFCFISSTLPFPVMTHSTRSMNWNGALTCSTEHHSHLFVLKCRFHTSLMTGIPRGLKGSFGTLYIGTFMMTLHLTLTLKYYTREAKVETDARSNKYRFEKLILHLMTIKSTMDTKGIDNGCLTPDPPIQAPITRHWCNLFQTLDDQSSSSDSFPFASLPTLSSAFFCSVSSVLEHCAPGLGLGLVLGPRLRGLWLPLGLWSPRPSIFKNWVVLTAPTPSLSNLGNENKTGLRTKLLGKPYMHIHECSGVKEE